MARFREARTEELVLSAIEKWRIKHPVEISRVDVDGNNIEIRLIFDVPLEKAFEVAAPAGLVSLELDEKLLINDIQRIVKQDITIIFSGQLRFTGVFESKGPAGSQR